MSSLQNLFNEAVKYEDSHWLRLERAWPDKRTTERLRKSAAAKDFLAFKSTFSALNVDKRWQLLEAFNAVLPSA
jgi:hypothetical protein